GTLFGVNENGLSFSSLIRGFESYVQTLWVSNPYSEYLSHSNINLNIANGSYESLSPGEPIEIIAINRKTGYMGSTRSTLGQINSGGVGYSENVIVMTPPNLTVKATRKYNTEHNLGNSDRPNQHTIAFEGSASNSDTMVLIEIEWLNQDGTPLPAAMADYGFTGRLVKVTDSGMALTEVGHFDITPGKRIENVQIPTDHEYSETFYLQISAKPQHENPTFGDLGASADGPLQYRPKHYVPFKVPVYDEILDTYRKTQYNALVAAGEQNLTPPETQYQYRYRPEYQFSLLDFELKNFKRQTQDQQVVEINSDKGYMVSSDDVALDILFSISDYQNQNIEPLPFLGVGQQLVLEVGGKEVELTLGENQQLTFNNPADLHQLEGEDFLFLQLYDNQDPDNILWEYAFQRLDIYPSRAQTDNIIEVSADDVLDNPQLVSAFFTAAPEGQLNKIQWSNSQNFAMTPANQQNDTGVFSTQFYLPTTAGTKVTVTASGDNADNGATSVAYEVIPGKPFRINSTTDGETVIGGLGQVQHTLIVSDQFGNPVADGTPVDVSTENLESISNLTTQGGQVVLKATGDTFSGEQPISVKVGNVTEQLTVNVHDIELSVSIPEEIEVGQTATVTIQATSAYGDLTALPVQVSNYRGRLSENGVLLSSAGQGSVLLEAGEFPGLGEILVRVGERFARKQFKVVTPPDTPTLSNNVIIAGAPDTTGIDLGGYTVPLKTSVMVDIPGQEGDSAELGVGTLDKPAIPALLHYPMSYISDNKVQDIVAKLDGDAQNIIAEQNHTKAGHYSFKFAGDSKVELFQYAKLRKQDNIGLTMHISPEQNQGTLLDYSASGLKIELSEQGNINVTATSLDSKGDDVKTLLSSQTLALNQWASVAVHVIDQELHIKIGDEEKSTPLPGKLKNTFSGKSFIVGENYHGNIADLKLYDWDEEPLIQLADGSSKGEQVIDATGLSQFEVIFNQNQLARFQKQRMREWEFNFINKAYANDLVFSCDTPFFRADEYGELTRGETFVKFISECNPLKTIQEVHLKITRTTLQTAVVINDSLPINIISRESAKKLYGLAFGSEDEKALALKTLKECKDGFITGDGEGVEGFTCDVISGIVGIADVRDFAVHSWYYYVTDDDRFDSSVQALAGLGIITSLAGYFSAGVGFAPDAVISMARAIAKLLPKDSKIIDLISDLAWQEAKKANYNPRQMGKFFADIMPFIEVTAFVAIEYKTLAQAGEILVYGIRDLADLQAWSRYVKGYFEQISSSQVFVNTTTFSLFAVAYAVDRNVISKTAQEFVDILKAVNVEQFLRSPTQKAQVSRMITNAIKELEVAVERGNEQLDKLIYKSQFIDAAVFVQVVGGRKYGLENLVDLRNIAKVELGNGMNIEQFVKEVSSWDILKHIDDGKIDSDVVTNKLSKVFRGLNPLDKDGNFSKTPQALNTSQGAAFQLLTIKSFLNKPGFKLLDIEELDKIAGFTRRYDVKVEKPDGTIVRYELKAWAPENIDKFLGCAFKKRDKVCKDTNEVGDVFYGQMFRDLVKLLKKSDSDPEIIWMFDSRSQERVQQIKELALSHLDENLEDIFSSADILDIDFDTDPRVIGLYETVENMFEIGEF
ncbi:hypothetical protein, partial [Catenovulum sediminis]